MTAAETRARAYCAEIGADPDETVMAGSVICGQRVEAPRWCWYVVSDETHDYERALAAQRKEQDSR